MVEANNIPGATYGREIDENGECEAGLVSLNAWREIIRSGPFPGLSLLRMIHIQRQ